MSFPPSVPVPEEVLEIARVLERSGHEAWCVGGALRDTLLGDPHSDFDLATTAPPVEVQRLFRRTAPIGVEHGTVGVIDRNRVLHEVTTFRRDVRTDGRHAVVESRWTRTSPAATSPSTRSPTIRSGTSGAIPTAGSAIWRRV
jgi:hypothetical protein